MQHRHDDFKRGLAFGRDHAHRNASAVVGDGSRSVFVERYVDLTAIASERFIYCVINRFKNDLMEAAHARVADVHARPSANAFKSFENLDLFGAVLLWIALAVLRVAFAVL